MLYIRVYSADTWPIKITDQNKLVFEWKYFGEMFVTVKYIETTDWRIRKNDKSKSLYRKPNVVEPGLEVRDYNRLLEKLKSNIKTRIITYSPGKESNRENDDGNTRKSRKELFLYLEEEEKYKM